MDKELETPEPKKQLEAADEPKEIEPAPKELELESAPAPLELPAAPTMNVLSSTKKKSKKGLIIVLIVLLLLIGCSCAAYSIFFGDKNDDRKTDETSETEFKEFVKVSANLRKNK
ncbi:MAG: hypothetical protein LBH36_02560 [Candidatus Nomurabacteria bacterium]|jgi:hypothetical protein|nr:hypothetical protein [Candidatus Nomurabacteria bacterium]